MSFMFRMGSDARAAKKQTESRWRAWNLWYSECFCKHVSSSNFVPDIFTLCQLNDHTSTKRKIYVFQLTWSTVNPSVTSWLRSSQNGRKNITFIDGTFLLDSNIMNYACYSQRRLSTMSQATTAAQYHTRQAGDI